MYWTSSRLNPAGTIPRYNITDDDTVKFQNFIPKKIYFVNRGIVGNKSTYSTLYNKYHYSYHLLIYTIQFLLTRQVVRTKTN